MQFIIVNVDPIETRKNIVSRMFNGFKFLLDLGRIKFYRFNIIEFKFHDP